MDKRPLLSVASRVGSVGEKKRVPPLYIVRATVQPPIQSDVALLRVLENGEGFTTLWGERLLRLSSPECPTTPGTICRCRAKAGVVPLRSDYRQALGCWALRTSRPVKNNLALRPKKNCVGDVLPTGRVSGPVWPRLHRVTSNIMHLTGLR